MKKLKNGNKKIYFCEEKYIELGRLVKMKSYTPLKVLKDDQRSLVELIEYKGEHLVLKKPLEKNRRRWQRFLSIFRGSSAFGEYRSCEKILESGFKGAKPVLVLEERKGPVVVDSYFVSSFIEGEEGSFSNLQEIGSQLEKVHRAGYLHGDSQLVNFIVGRDGVYLIDCKLSKNIYGKFGRRYEFLYLEKSCPKEIDIYPKNDIYFKGARMLTSYFCWWRKCKRKLRGKI